MPPPAFLAEGEGQQGEGQQGQGSGWGKRLGLGFGFGLEPVSATRRKVWAPRPTPSVTGAT